jgi:hypothetical protein
MLACAGVNQKRMVRSAQEQGFIIPAWQDRPVITSERSSANEVFP